MSVYRFFGICMLVRVLGVMIWRFRRLDSPRGKYYINIDPRNSTFLKRAPDITNYLCSILHLDHAVR
jgi:hypothetical protein